MSVAHQPPPGPPTEPSLPAPRFLPRLAVLLVMGLVALWAVPPLATVAPVALAAYALLGPGRAIQALALLFVVLHLNPALVAPSPLAPVLRWLVLIAAAARLLWDSAVQPVGVPRSVWAVLLFGATVTTLAAVASLDPLVSITKAAVFVLGAAVVLTGFHRTAHRADAWASWFFTLLLVLMAASGPLYASSLGFVRTGQGFQGLLNHPQTFGPVAATLAAWCSGLFIFRENRSSLVAAGAALGWAGLFASGARTALAMAGGGLVIAVALALLRSGRWRTQLLKALEKPRLLAVAVFAIAVAVTSWGALQQATTGFLIKYEESASVARSLEASRGPMIEDALNNFRRAPLTGIGFGMPSDLHPPRGARSGPLGLPVAAPIEKGFLPAAVLEEVGVGGALAFLALLAALVAPVWRGGGLPTLWLLATSLLVNVGEMVFFSFGGVGLFMWLLVGFAHARSTAPARRTAGAEDEARPAPLSVSTGDALPEGGPPAG